MSALDFLLYIAFFSIFMGSYQFYFLYVTKKAFDISVEEGYDKTWFQFCCEKFNNWIWKLRYKSKFRWFYESKLFIFFFRLKGIFLCLIGITIFILLFYLKNTEYWILVIQKF